MQRSQSTESSYHQYWSEYQISPYSTLIFGVFLLNQITHVGVSLSINLRDVSHWRKCSQPILVASDMCLR